MKKLIVLIGLYLCVLLAFAQTPQSFQYQSVVRDGNGDVVINQSVSFQVSLISGSSTGTVMYVETHDATTNAFGLVILAIGEGTVVSGSFAGINWSSALHFIKVEADITGGTNYVDMGTTQLLSVPYALNAKTSEDAFSGNYSDLNGVPVNVSSFSNDAGYITSPNDADADPANEMQTLSVAGNNLTIVGGNTVAIPQTTYTAGTGINVTGTTITNTAPNQIVSITGGGATTVTGTYPSFTVSSTDNVNDADANPSNEIQTLSVSGADLTISGGNTVTIPQTSHWGENAADIYNLNTGNVGVGLNVPNARLTVLGNSSDTPEEPLFEVKNRAGQTVFIVYEDSVRVYVDDDPAKTNKGAFAVSGRNTAKAFTNNFLWVAPDSTRIYTGDSLIGFGVQNIGSASNTSYMQLTPANYFIGHEAGNKISLNPSYSGRYNSFLGYQSGFNDTSGYKNYFIGYRAGYSNTSGYSNIFIGDSAGFTNTTGYKNVAVGNQAGKSNISGNYNVFLGYYTGFSNTANNNVFLGYSSGKNNTSGSNNVFVGTLAGFTNTTGVNSVYIGNYSGYTGTDGDNNVFLGYYTGYLNTADYNVFLGYESGRNNSSGGYNSFMGYQAGRSNTSGGSNVFIGNRSGYTNSTGESNVFLGNYAGYTNNANFNVFLGYESGRNNTIGTNNSFIGYLTGRSNTIGESNVFIGNNAGFSNTGGSYNLAIGQYALYSNTSYGNNIALGYNVLYSNTDGWDNLAIGNASMYYNSSGTSNVAVGEQALYRNTSGGANVSIGKWTIYYNNGSNNTAVGNLSFFSASPTTYSNSTAIGYGTPMTASNRVCLGNNSVAWIGGQVTWSTYSDARFKKNVNEDVPGLTFITQLRPVTYNYDMDAMAEFFNMSDSLRLPEAERNQAGITYTGFIAQEVDATAKKLGYNFSGVCKPQNSDDFYSLRYAEFTVPLVKAVQELNGKNEIFESEITFLKNENLYLRSVIEKMQEDIESLKSK